MPLNFPSFITNLLYKIIKSYYLPTTFTVVEAFVLPALFTAKHMYSLESETLALGIVRERPLPRNRDPRFHEIVGDGAPSASQVKVIEVLANNLMLLPTDTVSGAFLYHLIFFTYDAIVGGIRSEWNMKSLVRENITALPVFLKIVLFASI